MRKIELIKKIERLCTYGRIQTNDYKKSWLHKETEGEIEAYCTDSSLIIIQYENGVNRVLYYSLDFLGFKELLDKLDAQEYCIEFLSKEREDKEELFTSLGLKVLARMMRLANKDCRSIFIDASPVTAFLDTTIPCMATEKDVEEINRILWKVFDTRISHLPNNIELLASISRDEISVFRGLDGAIQAILQAKDQGRKFYINQIYNAGEKYIIHALMLERLKRYCDAGGKYLYAWVEENNIASIKFHNKYNMNPDGIWDLVYIREANLAFENR